MGSLRVRHNWATSFTFHFHSLEKEMATHSSVLAYGGAWWVSVSGVAQSRTRLKRLSSSSSSRLYYMLYNMLCQYVSVSFLIPNLIVYQNHLEILARNILPGPPTKRSDSVSLEWDLETLSWVHYVLILPMSTWWWYGYFKTKTKCSKFSNIKNISFYNIKAEIYFNNFRITVSYWNVLYYWINQKFSLPY